LEWSTFLGGTAIDLGFAIDVDAGGNVYVAGRTLPTDFPVTDGSTPIGSNDTFVTKFSPSGALLYSTLVGGRSIDTGSSLSVDLAGVVHVVGNTLSPDFPVVNPQDSCPPVVTSRNYDAFAFKLDPAGSTLLYSTCLGGGKVDVPFGGGALDAAGNLYVAGGTDSKKFPTKNNAAFGINGKCLAHSGDPDLAEGRDAFVLKLGPTGKLKYSTCWGGINSDEARGMAVDAAGNVYVGGWTNSTSFPQKRNAGVQTGTGGTEEVGWVLKVSTQPGPKFSTYLGGNDIGDVKNVAIDGGYVYVSGGTGATDHATKWPDAAAGGAQASYAGGFDTYVARLRFEAADPNAPIMDRITYLGGSGRDYPRRMVVRDGAVWLTGETASGDFPSVDPLAGTACAPTGQSPLDPYVARMDTALTTLSFSSCLGGPTGAEERGLGIAVDAAGTAYVTGYSTSADLPTTSGAHDTTYNGGLDAFVAKISPGP
ncbi:MAG: SBBP repeat-containing protein, partial [Acidimicrobiales bacterium]